MVPLKAPLHGSERRPSGSSRGSTWPSLKPVLLYPYQRRTSCRKKWSNRRANVTVHSTKVVKPMLCCSSNDCGFFMVYCTKRIKNVSKFLAKCTQLFDNNIRRVRGMIGRYFRCKTFSNNKASSQGGTHVLTWLTTSSSENFIRSFSVFAWDLEILNKGETK